MIFENVEICAEDDVANAAVVCNYNPYFIIGSVHTHTLVKFILFCFKFFLYATAINVQNLCAAVDIRLNVSN